MCSDPPPGPVVLGLHLGQGILQVGLSFPHAAGPCLGRIFIIVGRSVTGSMPRNIPVAPKTFQIGGGNVFRVGVPAAKPAQEHREEDEQEYPTTTAAMTYDVRCQRLPRGRKQGDTKRTTAVLLSEWGVVAASQ